MFANVSKHILIKGSILFNSLYFSVKKTQKYILTVNYQFLTEHLHFG
jgi:hypothetical protein